VLKSNGKNKARALCAAVCASLALSFTGCTTTLGKSGSSDISPGDAVAAAATRLDIATPPNRAEKDPLIMVHYMPWFQAPPVESGYGFHWHQGGAVYDPFETTPDGRAKIASHYYPLTGPYDTRDVSVLEYQVALMKISGIDGVIFDWYGIEDALDYKQINQSTLEMIKVLKKAGMKFAVCYEDQSIGKMVEAKNIAKEDSIAAGKKVFAWMQDNWFSDDAYLKIDGRPVVLCFGPQYYKDQGMWTDIFSVLSGKPWFVSLDNHSEGWVDGSYNWPPMWASTSGKLGFPRLVSYLNDFYAKQNAKSHLVASAFPGFHDIYKEAGNGQSYGFLDYAGGATFRLTLDAALRACPDVIQIGTWNDYGEGTIVEPTIEHGYKELEVLQDTQKKDDGNFPYQYDDLRAPIELFRIISSGKATAAQKDSYAAALRALYAGNAAGFRSAIAAAGIKPGFSVEPVLRAPSTKSEVSGAAVVYDPAGKRNLALGAPVVASSHIYDFTGSKMIDGDLKTYWEGSSASWPNDVTVDLVSVQQLSTVVLKLNPARIWDKRTQRIEVRVSSDGQDFIAAVPETAYMFDPAENANTVAIKLNVKARYIRLVFTANTAAKAGQAAELEVYGE
jgi:hypothetical protein